jgi:hypothetical protein
MDLRRFGRADLERFLQLVDSRLPERCTVVIVGGAVAALLGGPVTTGDIDVWSADPGFWEVCREIAGEGAVLPIHPAGIAQPPYDFEDRLIALPLPELSRLVVAMPEIHDWAIMKIARGHEHDLQHVEALHARTPFQLPILVERFRNTEALGNRRMFELAFLDLVERLFGADQVTNAEAAIRP